MKHFTLIALGVAMLAASPAEARLQFIGKKPAASTEKTSGPRRYMSAAAQNAPIWRSTTQRDYGWTGSEWVLDVTYTMSYTPEGLVAVETGESEDGTSRETYTYNENGKMVKKLSEYAEVDEDFQNTERVEREYDPRLISLVTANSQWMWNGSAWDQNGNNYTRTITRNTDGNITLTEIAVLYQGIYDPTQRVAVTYGADGKATQIEEKHLMYNDQNQLDWVVVSGYKDIVWERTDGQLYTTDNLFYDNNRIASASFYDGEGSEAQMTVEYDGGKYDLHLTGMLNDEEVEQWQTFTPGENGGYKLQNRCDYKMDGQVYYTEILTTIEKYDSFGLILLQETDYSDGTYAEVEEKLEGTVTYDDATGCPLTYTARIYDYDADEMVNLGRTEYEGYIDTTAGIGSIEADGTDAPPSISTSGHARCESRGRTDIHRAPRHTNLKAAHQIRA